jgi:hypothetical protein
MCRRIRCRKCGRPDWSGCGRHVEEVLHDVPPAQRCHCREERAAARRAAGAGRSWWSRLLGR